MKDLKPKFKARLHGLFSQPIPYEVRNPKGDWSPYFGQWEAQKKGWWDTNSCWSYAGNEVLEDQMEFLMKTDRFTKEDLNWFDSKGYIDSDGDFYFSRRFIPILSGVRTEGNDHTEHWRLTCKYGAIPNSMLPEVTDPTNYFNPDAITEEMLALGREFLTRVDIRYEELGKRFKEKDTHLLRTALMQGELQIGVPIPDPAYLWNVDKVKYDGSRIPAHSVAFYKYDEKADPEYPYFIYDQYHPMLKQLSKDYYIPLVTRVVVNPKIQYKPNTVSQQTLWAKIWTAIAVYFGFNAKDSQVSA